MFIVCLDPRLFWPHQKGLGSILGEPLHKAEITLFHFSLELVLSLGQQCIWISSTGTENFFQLSLSPDYGIPYRLLLTTWPHPRPHQRRPGNEAKVSMCVCVCVHAPSCMQTYFPAFEACVREGLVASIMCSYNEVNGVPSCANDLFQNKVVRDQWGFTGFIVSV